MESEINREIREVLEKFGVTTNEIIGDWKIEGHLRNVANNHAKREFVRQLQIIVRKEENTLQTHLNSLKKELE